MEFIEKGLAYPDEGEGVEEPKNIVGYDINDQQCSMNFSRVKIGDLILGHVGCLLFYFHNYYYLDINIFQAPFIFPPFPPFFPLPSPFSSFFPSLKK